MVFCELVGSVLRYYGPQELPYFKRLVPTLTLLLHYCSDDISTWSRLFLLLQQKAEGGCCRKKRGLLFLLF